MQKTKVLLKAMMKAIMREKSGILREFNAVALALSEAGWSSPTEISVELLGVRISLFPYFFETLGYYYFVGENM